MRKVVRNQPRDLAHGGAQQEREGKGGGGGGFQVLGLPGSAKLTCDNTERIVSFRRHASVNVVFRLLRVVEETADGLQRRGRHLAEQEQHPQHTGMCASKKRGLPPLCPTIS